MFILVNAKFQLFIYGHKCNTRVIYVSTKRSISFSFQVDCYQIMVNVMCIAGLNFLWSPADEWTTHCHSIDYILAGTKATEDMTSAFAPINLLYPCTYGVDHAMQMLI